MEHEYRAQLPERSAGDRIWEVEQVFRRPPRVQASAPHFRRPPQVSGVRPRFQASATGFQASAPHSGVRRRFQASAAGFRRPPARPAQSPPRPRSPRHSPEVGAPRAPTSPAQSAAGGGRKADDGCATPRPDPPPHNAPPPPDTGRAAQRSIPPPRLPLGRRAARARRDPGQRRSSRTGRRPHRTDPRRWRESRNRRAAGGGADGPARPRSRGTTGAAARRRRDDRSAWSLRTVPSPSQARVAGRPRRGRSAQNISEAPRRRQWGSSQRRLASAPESPSAAWKWRLTPGLLVLIELGKNGRSVETSASLVAISKNGESG